MSDFGLEDAFVGMMHGVVARVAPQARIIDLCHGLPPFKIVPAAMTLRRALPFTPPGVHVAVVDPGVGTSRMAVAVSTAGGRRTLVGPNNGVLWPALEYFGGPLTTVNLDLSPVRLEPVSNTFHARDIFAPVAAHLATGASLESVGRVVADATLVRLDIPMPVVTEGSVTSVSVDVDRFGNISTNAGPADLRTAGIEKGDTVDVTLDGNMVTSAVLVDTFGEVQAGATMVFVDSSGAVGVAVKEDTAAARLGVTRSRQSQITLTLHRD